MARKRIIILGAGLTGLSAAWHLQKRGLDCQIFEKEAEVGGLSRSKNIDGFIFDYAGHLLHFKRAYAFNLIKSLLANNLLEHQRSSWIYSFDRYIRYPFQANLYGLPSSIIKECLIGFIQALKDGQTKPKKKLSFLEWINQTFGKGIAKHFMIPYNNKFWTIPPEELICDWLDGFIPVPSLSQILEGTIEESQRQFGYNARFWYPKKGGIKQVALALASQLKNINTGCPINGIDLTKKEIKLYSGNRERFDYLISTIPLPEAQHLIKDLPQNIRSLFKKLRWNSIFNLNLGIERKDRTGRHWLYFPQKDLSFFRVGFFHNFSSYLAPADKSSLYIEVAYSRDNPIQKNKIIPRIKEDLKKIGILRKTDQVCCQQINDIKYGYPIYDVNYSQARKKILNYLIEKDVIPCGRFGSWRYMSMEDVILDGKAVAEGFLRERAVDEEDF
jgi:UDP-galactopyranose mutase